LIPQQIGVLEKLLKEFKDTFEWIYKDLKGMAPKLAQHKIELNTTIPLTHEAKYYMNPNYVIKMKHAIDKLLTTRFIELVEEVTLVITHHGGSKT
jgi:hypothetical protein